MQTFVKLCNDIHGVSKKQTIKIKSICSGYKRKIQEMYLSIELEKKLTKDQILEAYLNTIPLGGKLHGVEAASEQYFSKHAKDLTLTESAYIGGVTQNPSKFYPFTISKDNAFVPKKDLSPIITRTKTVLSKMYDLGKITKEQYEEEIKKLKPIKLRTTETEGYAQRGCDSEKCSL